MLYQYTIYPIECVYKILYLFFADVLGHYGLALIALSLLTSFIIHPFMKWAARLQKEEKHLQDVMKPQLDAIKAESKGAEQYQRIQRMYKRYGYHPIMAIRSALGVALQIPFLMAAFYMLSKLPDIQGVTWGIVRDLGKPDALLNGYNVFPFVMTAVNLSGAFTTKGFSSRDRLQAIVIAGLFLVLLYSAPSALLIYWTCNNLWTLLGNVKGIIAERCGVTVPQITVAGKSLPEWIANIPDALYVCLAFALTVCVLVPADVYLVNKNELWFTLPDILLYLLLGALVLLVLFSVIYFVLPNRKPRAIFVAIITGLLLGFFLQSYVINLDYGILDGRTIKWYSFKKEAVLNCLVWGTCVLIPLIALRYMDTERFVKLSKKAALFLVVVQICSAFYVAASSGDKQNKVEDNMILTTEGEFSVSSKENIIVFLLDAFESKTFREIQKRNPELVKKLNGFVYYPNAESLFGYTDYSVPQMLTNIKYENQCSYKDYLKEAWKSTTFFKFLRDKNYDVRLFTFSNFMIGAEGQFDNLKKAKYVIDKKTLKNFAKLTLFREMPHLLKKQYVIYSGVLRDPAIDNTKIQPYKENDVVFYNELKKGIQIRNNKNCFRFYHLNGPHQPYTMNSKIRRVKKGQKVTMYEQAVGSLKIAIEFIDQMKKNRAFDNTTFAILADHGKHNSIVTSPLVLIKQPKAANQPLETRHNAISYTGLQATLLQRYGNESLQFGENFEKLNEKEREFYILKSEQDREFSLVKYLIAGNTDNKAAWKKQATIKSFNVNPDDSYILGTRITFSNLGNSSKYVRSGWAQAVLNHRTMIAKIGTCSLSLKNYTDGDLELMVTGGPVSRELQSSFVIHVFAGDEKIDTWSITGFKQYNTIIPAALIKNNKLSLRFEAEQINNSKSVQDNRLFLVALMQINSR